MSTVLALAALALTAAPQSQSEFMRMQFASPAQKTLNSSYPWNTYWPDGLSEGRPQLGAVILGRFKLRERFEAKLKSDVPGYPDPTFWLDRFQDLGDDGKVLPSTRKVVTAELIQAGTELEPGRTYLLAFRAKPASGSLRVALGFDRQPLPISIEMPEGHEIGLMCIPARKVVRALDREGTEDPLATTLLSIVESLRGVNDLDHARAMTSLLSRLDIYLFASGWRPLGNNEFRELFLAGERSAHWIERNLTPLLESITKELTGDVKLAPLALLTMMPGGEPYGREMFELLKGLAAQKKWRLAHLCDITSVPLKERMQAAHQYPGQPREFFFPFPDVGGIEAKKRPPPPDDATIRTIISWLPSARPTFAIRLLKLLASWADRSQMSPDLKLNPKVSTGPWKNGEPVVENLEFLIKLWRENPPPIRRTGA